MPYSFLQLSVWDWPALVYIPGLHSWRRSWWSAPGAWWRRCWRSWYWCSWCWQPWCTCMHFLSKTGVAAFHNSWTGERHHCTMRWHQKRREVVKVRNLCQSREAGHPSPPPLLPLLLATSPPCSCPRQSSTSTWWNTGVKVFVILEHLHCSSIPDKNLRNTD